MTSCAEGTGVLLSTLLKEAGVKDEGKWMVAEGYLAFDPTARLPKTKVPRRRPRPLRLEHIEILRESGAYRRTREMITIAALTGLRIGEIVKIRGEDVDFIAGTIRSIRKGGLDHVVFMQADVRAIAESKPRTGGWFPSPYANRQFPDGDGHVLMKSASSGISRLLRRCRCRRRWRYRPSWR